MKKETHLFYAACRVLKNNGQNQFVAARRFAAIVFCETIDETADCFEIPARLTKTGAPVVVNFN